MDNLRFKNIFRIPTARLPNWDYSSTGWYFVTICVKNRECCLGNITDRKMRFSSIGKIAQKYWLEIPNHYQNVTLDEYNILPNHIHGIIIIHSSVETGHAPSLRKKNHSIGNIIGSFKSASSNKIHKFKPNFFWQPRFYDHIIKNEQSLNKIRSYIRFNPLNWDTDEENPQTPK